jgi:sphingomyelin phosphodiesterase
LEYKQGTVEDCGIPQCCREGKGNAGKWGGFNCDLPLGTLEAALEQIKTQNPDFVIITGDFPPHDVWNQSKPSNLHYQSVVAETFQRILPDTKLLPIYGNHACYPINQCKLGKDNWIAKPFIEAWNLPLGHLFSLQYHGGYSEKIKKNLRLIALDTNTDNCGNLQISKNSTDPLGQLSWLYLQLLEAEKNNEKVFIFGHISPGDVDALGIWGKHFNVLMDRFEYTVAGQFYGHSHIDQIHINKGVYDQSKATSVQWVAPSLTTYTNNNPAFRVFEADLHTHRLIEIYQYRMNLVERNKFKERPAWDLAYKFTELYGVFNIDPETVLGIGNQMENDVRVVNIYRTQAYGNGFDKDCDIDCRRYFYCSVTQGVINDIIACQGVSEEGLLSTLLQQFFSKWTYKVA